MNCCSSCGQFSILNVNGEYTCISCGLVSPYPVYELDSSYLSHSYYVSVPVDDVLDRASGLLLLSPREHTVSVTLYNEILALLCDPPRHRVLLFGVCVYLTHDRYTLSDLCSLLDISVRRFHSMYLRVSRLTGRFRSELNVDSYISRVCSLLCVVDSFRFKRDCLSFYHSLVLYRSGLSQLRQVRYLKLFSVIGYIVMTRGNYTIGYRGDIFSCLDISRPTFSKISRLIDDILSLPASCERGA